MHNLFADAIHETLHGMLVSTWSADTSADSGWAPEAPERGQGDVTALVVQDVFGGALLRGTVGGVSHYWNRLPDGEEVDLTRAQFPDNSIVEETRERDREHLLSSGSTFRRYQLLSSLVFHDL